MDKPRVVYWNNIPTPYVVGRFNALSRRAKFEFEAWFNEPREPDRSWDVDENEWMFRARYIRLRSFAGVSLRPPLAEIRRFRPQLLVSLYASPSFALGSLLARSMGSRTVFRVLPTYDSWVHRTRGKELMKQALFRTIDAAKVPGPDGERVARRYGVPAERIHRVRQSVDVEHFGIAVRMDRERRARRRQEFGLNGCVFLYVGRLWSGKGIDDLLHAYRLVREQTSAVSLLLVGDGVDEDRYRRVARGLPGVEFAGFVQPKDLPEYFGLGDVLVFPTLGDPNGVVVEEGMAAGLPVIATEAAGDIRQRVPEGKVGYVVPPGDPARLAERMLLLAGDPESRQRLSAEARRAVADQTHEAWASDFERLVDLVLSMPRRRSPFWPFARGFPRNAVPPSGTAQARGFVDQDA